LKYRKIKNRVWGTQGEPRDGGEQRREYVGTKTIRKKEKRKSQDKEGNKGVKIL